MLVLNAGTYSTGLFSEMSFQDVQDVTTVNALHVMYTTKVLIDKMKLRVDRHNQKCGIMVTSSALA